MRFWLTIYAPDGTVDGTEIVELPRLPDPGTSIRPPVSSRPCFVTRALPASIHDTGDITIAGTVFADAVREPALIDC
jgi:hypothetical protein